MSFRTQAICSFLLAVCGIASAQDRPSTLGCDDPREREQEAQAIRKLAGDVVKLINKGGRWDWLPKKKCPDTP